jgi:hypothetical protein
MRGRPACSRSGLLWRFTMSWALMGVLCPEANTSTRTCCRGAASSFSSSRLLRRLLRALIARWGSSVELRYCNLRSTQ